MDLGTTILLGFIVFIAAITFCTINENNNKAKVRIEEEKTKQAKAAAKEEL